MNGENVTFHNAFTYTLSLTGRLDSPEASLPSAEECLHIRIHAAPALLNALRQVARLERVATKQRAPQIDLAQDSLLGLSDVLDPNGALLLNGDDLFFDRAAGLGECLIRGTRSGSTVQTRFVKLEASEIIIMPTVPAQDDPWNNEYTVSLSVRYSEHGTLRTGIYQRRLRTPLAVAIPDNGPPSNIGIMTGNAPTPAVSVTGGTVSADERLRIQALLDIRADHLLVNLIDMQEGGAAGTAVEVTQNGDYILPGYSGSAVSSLAITVNDYEGLRAMVHDDYAGRLLDILDVSVA